MSRTSVVKQKILKILSDGKEHFAYDIKEEIRRNGNEDISEGVFAGSFRALVIEKKCENPERGIYVINPIFFNDSHEERDFQKRHNIIKENENNLALRRTITQSFDKMEAEINAAMKGIDISVSDSSVLEYCLEIKKICTEMRKKLNNVNRILK